MKKLFAVFVLTVFFFSKSFSQFSTSDCRWFIGIGSDTAYLVIDFNEPFGNSSFMWGYLYSGFLNGSTLLSNIDAMDDNLSIATAAGFLNDITYNTHSGIGGSPDFWGTWSDSAGTWVMNAGLTDTVHKFFGCSYTDFASPIAPQSAAGVNPAWGFDASYVQWWIGSGTDSAILFIDFLDNGGSYAWGYRYNPPATATDMLTDILLFEDSLQVNIAGGFLTDIIYQQDMGMSGAPNYWGTWSATNFGNWYLNGGLGDTLLNGQFYGCTYTDFFPALMPHFPLPVREDVPATAIHETIADLDVTVTSEEILLQQNSPSMIHSSLYNADGKLVAQQNCVESSCSISVRHLPAGVYLLQVENGSAQSVFKICKSL